MPPTTRMATRALGWRSRLLELPDELLELLNLALSDHDLVHILRLSQTCHELHTRLSTARQAAEARRLYWDEMLVWQHYISGPTITGTQTILRDSWADFAWAAGSVLPTHGTFSFTVRIDRSWQSSGLLYIGVCDEAAQFSYGFIPWSGQLWSYMRDGDGNVSGAEDVSGHSLNLPVGFPAPQYGKKLMHLRDNTDPRTLEDLEGHANGALITCIVDQGAHTLSFRVDGEPSRGDTITAVSGLPAGVALRPWVRLYKAEGDQVSLITRYV